MGPPPIVTGVSPKEGPPGTRVTVRGEFLGKTASDLSGLTICGCDCLLSAEWKSPNKIIARSGPGKGKGEILVTTRSGGRGTSTVEFRGYHEMIGPMKESAVWVEEAPLRKMWWGRRGLTPTTYQHDDPLGISIEGVEQKFPEDGLHKLFPGGSGDLSSENFAAGWFLLERHHATPFDDLRAGLAFLRRKVDGQKEGQLSFIKSNVGSVMEQLDTLAHLKERFEEDVEKQGQDPTIRLEAAIKESMLEANKLFEDVLSRRERADATRSALAVLQRFRFLFGLPGAIEKNIKKGDYDAVINDYARVMNLFGNTEVPVFKKVLAEVESRIAQLRELLHHRLEDAPTTLEAQKKLIRNLVNLEVGGDPAWDAISCHSRHLAATMIQCRDTHLTQEQTALEEGGKTPKSSKSKGASSSNQNTDWQASVPARVLLTEELADTISERFPDFWKLGQAYFTGELQVKVVPGRQQDFKKLVLAGISLFSGLLRAALMPHTLVKTPAAERASYGVWHSRGMEGLGPWLPHCLRALRQGYSSLIRLDLPSEVLDIVASLIFDLRVHCMSTLMKQAGESIRNLHTQESWNIQFDGEHGGITHLPAECERVVAEALQLAKDSVLLADLRETPLLESNVVQRDLNNLILNMLLGFVEVLDKLALGSDAMAGDSLGASQMIGSPSIFRGSDSVMDKGRNKDKETGPAWEQRLLSVLSNIEYTKCVLLPRIADLFARYQLPAQTGPLAAVNKALAELDQRVLDAYLEQRSDPLVGTIEPSMYIGNFNWDTAVKPADVRPYVKELLTNLISVHSEVHSISPGLVWRVLPQLVETVAEELARLMVCLDRKFNVHGTEQACADIAAIREAVQVYSTPTAEAFFDEALEAVPRLSDTQGKKNVETVLNHFRSRMRLQLMCFRDPKGTRNPS
ncbi:exocyst complex component 2 [Thrips palmi]|uniref:Exocyst complex component 2 n=1 Tax=Thrips palmi TaxID=161013 RepID=A0A6P8YNF1_THRPL|nr:exocyst complex component 2 [Thrips palmi]